MFGDLAGMAGALIVGSLDAILVLLYVRDASKTAGLLASCCTPGSGCPAMSVGAGAHIAVHIFENNSEVHRVMQRCIGAFRGENNSEVHRCISRCIESSKLKANSRRCTC